MNTNTNIFSVFFFLMVTVVMLIFVFPSQTSSNTDIAPSTTGIILPLPLAPDDIISADEWNKIRNALIALAKRTSEINIANDGEMGVGLHGKDPEADLHIKGSTYANADILLEDGEGIAHRWNIGGGEVFAISKAEKEKEMLDGISIEYENRLVGIRTHDPKVSLHILKGEGHEGVDYVQSPKKTVIIENIYDSEGSNTNLKNKENNILSFLTASKSSSTGIQFETSENEGWKGWMGFFHEFDHTKHLDFDEDSKERFLFLSSVGKDDLPKIIANSLIINANGNTGIGLEKPFHKLHIYDNPAQIPSPYQTLEDPRFETNTSFVSETSQGDANIGIAVNNSSATSKIQFSDKDLNDGEGELWDGIIEYMHGGDDLALSTLGQPYKAVLKSNGYFGVGTKRNVGFKFHAKCPKEQGYDCDEIIGMFENPKPGGDPSSGGGGAYVAASSADAQSENAGAGFLAQQTMGTKGSLIHMHKKDVFVLEKTSAGYMAINSKGMIGVQIGKSDPDKIMHQLHIQECDTAGMSQEDSGSSCNESEQNVIVAAENNIGSNAYLGAGAPEKVGIKFVPGELKEEWKGLMEYDNTKNKLSFGTNSENHRMDIDEKGWVGINKEDPEHGVHFIPKDEIMKLEGRFGINTSPSYGIHFIPKDEIMKVEGRLGVNKEPIFDIDAVSVNGDQLCVGSDCISAWTDLEKYFTSKTHVHQEYAPSSHSHGESSDKHLKTNITSLENTLEKLKSINGVSYNWRSFTRKGDQTEIGVIAQDVEKVFPELVSTDNDGFKSVQYSHLVAVLIEGIKEQQIQIESLEERIQRLEVLIEQ